MLYLAKGRRYFTEASFATLLDSTDWNLVDRLFVYDDGSTKKDNSREAIRELLPRFEVHLHDRVHYIETSYGSPVAVMNDYLGRSTAEMFAKIDNDIIVPPFWLNRLLDVMVAHPHLELLGMQPGMGAPEGEAPEQGYQYVSATHIGGVGLMRTGAFWKRPVKMVADGRFGFTEWQHTQEPLSGWITPDLRMFSLDWLPVEPWRELTEAYMKKPDLQRRWPLYSPSMSRYWSWWTQ